MKTKKPKAPLKPLTLDQWLAMMPTQKGEIMAEFPTKVTLNLDPSTWVMFAQIMAQQRAGLDAVVNYLLHCSGTIDELNDLQNKHEPIEGLYAGKGGAA